VKGKEERKRNEARARGMQVPSGGRIAKCGKFIKIDDKRPYTEGVQITHFTVEKPRET